MGVVGLHEVVRRVLREHKLAALARMIAFDTELPPVEVLGDAEKLRTIVDNLVSNAVKYSPRSGTITLSLAVGDGLAVLDVTDEGPGVSPDEREKVFDSFYQGAPPAEGRVKGSGLGLAIAREYVLAHGGRIEAGERRDGRRGARFRVSLPLPSSQAAVADGNTAVVLAAKSLSMGRGK